MGTNAAIAECLWSAGREELDSITDQRYFRVHVPFARRRSFVFHLHCHCPCETQRFLTTDHNFADCRHA